VGGPSHSQPRFFGKASFLSFFLITFFFAFVAFALAALAFGRLRIARYKSPGVRWPYAVRSDGDIPFTNSTAFHQLHGNTVQVLLQRGQVGFSSRASNQAMSDDDAISHPQG